MQEWGNWGNWGNWENLRNEKFPNQHKGTAFTSDTQTSLVWTVVVPTVTLPPAPPLHHACADVHTLTTVKYVSQLGNIGKTNRSSPVSDKSYHTNVLARTFENKEETLSPIFLKTAVKTCQTSLFHNNNKSNNYNHIINNNTIQTNLDKLSVINWNTLLQHTIQGLLSCDVDCLYYNSSTSAKLHRRRFFFLYLSFYRGRGW